MGGEWWEPLLIFGVLLPMCRWPPEFLMLCRVFSVLLCNVGRIVDERALAPRRMLLQYEKNELKRAGGTWCASELKGHKMVDTF